jgi:tetratricopeptide (TPR) repeat protein
MNPQAESLFHEVADLSPEQRDAFFRMANVPKAVREEVETLLHFDAAESEPLTESVAKCAERLLERDPLLRAGGRCGPYRLVRVLGRGGMGSVYLAERDDGEVEQRAAIKFLRFGGDGPGFRERFLRERQILATLNHPGIARLLDAGHTAEGQPYLVMEYVEGEPIDVYAGRLDLPGRLNLFLQVCDAVSYAHRNLIVHRDLKPSNILVEASGHPKLLDFGIAKILDAAVDETQTRDCLLTPGYASPEQVRGAANTTATDIYSLGAVLYKLLTGQSPHALTRDAKQDAPTVPGAPSGNAVPNVPRDLDFITGKALREEPEERYSTVESLAEDVQAFLEFRPVRARAGDTWYRVRKFARRYWVPLAATAAVLASLAGGLYVANRERLHAERRFRELRQLSVKVFDLDKAIRNLPGSAGARQRLVTTSLEYLEGLRADARGDLDLAQEMADDYWRVARVQGVPVELNLGQVDNAEKSLQHADALTESILAARPADRSALYRSATIASDRMILAQEEHRREAAIGFARQAEQRAAAFLAHGRATGAERGNIAVVYTNVGQAYRNMHLQDDAVRNARRAVEIARSLNDGHLSATLSLLALVLREQGDLDAALSAVVEARAIAEHTVYSSETERMIGMYAILTRQAAILSSEDGVSLGRAADAVEPLQNALDLTEEAARQNPEDFTSRSRLSTAARELGSVLRASDPQRALDVYDLGIRRIAEVPTNPSVRRSRASLLANSSYPLRALGRNAEARQRIEQAVTVLREMGEYPAERLTPESAAAVALRAQADYADGVGDPRGAIRIYEQLLQKIAPAGAAQVDLWSACNLAHTYQRLADLNRKTGDAERASEMEARRLALWRDWSQKLPGNPFVLRQMASM